MLGESKGFVTVSPKGEGASDGEPGSSPVPKVSMDYFYISNRVKGSRPGPSALSTKELKKRLAQMGKSTHGARHVLLNRYEKYRKEEEEQDEGEETPAEEGKVAPHASDSPMMVMVDEATGNKYMRAVPHKGLGDDGDNSWLIKDMHQ